MSKGFVHTVFKDGQWTNEVEDDDGADRLTYPTKEEAVDAGRALAVENTTEHVIHNQDGTFAERNSYGNDPANRPG